MLVERNESVLCHYRPALGVNTSSDFQGAALPGHSLKAPVQAPSVSSKRQFIDSLRKAYTPQYTGNESGRVELESLEFEEVTIYNPERDGLRV